jgi:hypothetical protein
MAKWPNWKKRGYKAFRIRKPTHWAVRQLAGEPVLRRWELAEAL